MPIEQLPGHQREGSPPTALSERRCLEARGYAQFDSLERRTRDGNTGTAVAHWTAAISDVSDFSWLTLDSMKGTLAAGSTVTLTVTANSANLHPRLYTTAITITAGGKVLTIPVTVMVTS
jgi:hypothetical protein